jgi:hypothetical protein
MTLNLTIAHKILFKFMIFCTIDEFDFVIQKDEPTSYTIFKLRILFKYYKLTFFWSCTLVSIYPIWVGGRRGLN